LAGIARAQPGCKALQRRYGIGWLTAVATWAEFGEVRRFANARQAVRFCGLDITIAESDGKRARGHLARQGSPVLRWALHEAAMCAARPSSPDHADYLQVRQRLGGKRAALSVARKLARKAYHTLKGCASRAGWNKAGTSRDDYGALTPGITRRSRACPAIIGPGTYGTSSPPAPHPPRRPTRWAAIDGAAPTGSSLPEPIRVLVPEPRTADLTRRPG
jgi:hypothetical protein